MIYSHSRLETFEQCRLKFKYQYIEKVPVTRRDSIEAFLGSRVHDTLETLYRHKMMSKEWTKEEYFDFYKSIWKEKHPETLSIVKKEYTEEDYFQQGSDALAKYWEHYYPFEQEKTISLEQRIIISLDDSDRYRLQGFIDRLSKTVDDVWQVRDYKTKRTLPTQSQADQDRQLALYQLGVQHHYPQAEQVELIWHYVIFDEEVKSVRDKESLDETRRQTIEIIDRVEKAVVDSDFELNESQLCNWCDFFDICPAKKHLSKVIELSPQEFAEEDGVQLVDKYVSFKNKQTEIKKMLDNLRDELIEYARQMEITRVYGSDSTIKLGNFPSYKALDRKFLERILKEQGLWEKVTNLYLPKVIKLIDGKEVTPELEKQLISLIEAEVGYRLTISKLKD